MKPHIFLSSGRWWVRCKHGDRTGPYRDLETAMIAAETIWVF